jgi:hypothetical protein
LGDCEGEGLGHRGGGLGMWDGWVRRDEKVGDEVRNVKWSRAGLRVGLNSGEVGFMWVPLFLSYHPYFQMKERP